MKPLRSVALDDRTIQFIDRQQPGLQAGRYTLDAQQVIETSPRRTYTARRSLLVQAARFALPESEVQSYYPPRGATGQFQNDLPQVVLFDPALPWQRALPGGSANAPWLALLLLERGEVLPPKIAPNDDSATGAANYKLSEVLGKPEPGTFGPQNLTLEEGQALSDVCSAIDIAPATFKRVVPYLQELDYLAHCRNVDLRRKANEVAVTDGIFSLVIGNRFPRPPAGDDAVRYVAHLVSIEGFAGCLNPAFQFGGDVQRVRMVSLIDWNFACRAGANFGELMTKLVATAQTPGDLLLRLPPPAGDGAAADAVRRALSRGFVALGYDTRSGESTFAWYRGPFAPERLKSFATRSPPLYESGSAAAIYDETSGTFDLTYSAAWQIGRLISLANGSYAAAKLGLRRRVRRAIDRIRERLSVQPQLMEGSAEDLLASQSASDAFFDWLGEEMPAVLGGGGPLEGAPETRTTPILTTAPENCYAELHILLHHELGVAAANLIATRELRTAASGPVVDGDAALKLFYGVPADLLIPDARLLPPDSIRFFFVDPNYIAAMLDGAHSIGVDSTRTAIEQSMLSDALTSASDDAASSHRAKLIGDDSVHAEQGMPAAGFLLRSALVSGWPGLEVAADRKTAGGTEELKPLRMDILPQSDILLLLYPNAPDRISFTEPRESLTFGMDEQQRVQLRFISGADAGKTTGATATIDKFRNDARVIDIAALQNALRSAVGGSGWGPAAFALQMIRAPRRMWFYNPQLPPPAAQLLAGMEESAHV